MNNLLKYMTGIVIVVLMLANSSDPPNGRTGAPGDGVCSSCHQGNNFEGNILIDNLPDVVTSGETYTLGITVNNTDGNAVRAGFQMVALFNDNFNNAGDFMTNSDDEGTSVLGDRKYIEHRGAKNFQDNVAQWIFEWEAPVVDTEQEILMFAAGNIANGSGSGGDAIKFNEALTTIRPAAADTIKVEIQVVDIICNGDNGDLTAVASGGEGEYRYSWSNGINAAENNDVPAGFYSVTVTDSNDSMAVAEIILEQPEILTFDLVVSNETSVDANDGSIQASITGGTSPYQYLWSNGETTSSIDSLSPGEYSLTATDANGCMDTISAIVESAACAFTLNLSFNDITCPGANDGEAIIDPVGFEQPFSFEWSNGDNAFIAIAGLEPGDYDITVTDGSGCTIVEGFTLTDPEPLVLESEVSVEDCENFSQNTLSITATGGTGTYTYLWSNGDNTSEIINVPEGIYAVTVTDENGCEAVSEENLVVFEDTEAPVVIFTDSVDLYVDADGMLDFSPLNLEEADNCGIESVVLAGDTSCDALGPRTLTYEVVDVNGNVTIAEIFIKSIIDTIPPTADCIGDIFQEGCDTIFYDIPNFQDNCAIASIELAEGLPSGSIFPKDSTKVTYNVFDEAGNFFCCSFWVITNNDLVLTVDEVQNASAGNGGTIDISIEGGTGNYEYEWTLNDTLTVSNFEDVSNLEPGAYRVAVRDESGCLIISETILIEMESSTESFDNKEIKVFPNPVMEELLITSSSEVMGFQIFSLDGRQMNSTSNRHTQNMNSVDVRYFTPGLYVLKVELAEGIKTIKFIKN
ncbi:choice-of-anchor V domain-containing protein [Portibacter marinus]|uniref:choice-of-anchor V domain-containing protein n=1 Tax=Portibacter marinus TaxID=2898660 RepID=UPI001F247E2A|nr:choice-of-anchor V domain-containing protein [Portibacter marinus]